MTDGTSRTLRGAAAGFAATGPMTVLMEAVHPALPPHERDPLPPRQVTENTAAAAGVAHELTDGQLEAATMAAHFGFGTAAGLVYGLTAARLPLPAAARGVAFGLGVWAASYLGLLPGAGLYTSSTREPARRHALMIAAHVVWGAVLGRVEEELAGRGG